MNLTNTHMHRLALGLWREEEGVTAIEYGLLAALIAVVIIGAVTATGTSLSAVYVSWSTAVMAAL